MRPPPAHGAAVPIGWDWSSRSRRRAAPARRLSRRARHRGLALLSTTLLATSLVAAWAAAPSSPEGHAGSSPALAPGTAALGTATCADWQDAGNARRLATVRALGIAATRPDPENPGATLETGAAYGLFQRVCSTRASGSTLLYEAYNRAASFQSVQAGYAPISAPLGQP